MEHQRHLSSSDIALDQVLQEAVAYLELGDTITTTALLDNALEALPGSSVRLLSIVPTAAAAVRAMALRAELASRAGDRLNARRWGQAVATLWSAGDVENRVVSRRALPLGSMAGR
jgi:Tfp pilus assembly protein PilF